MENRLVLIIIIFLYLVTTLVMAQDSARPAIFRKDQSKYSKTFLQGLHYPNTKVYDDYMTVEGRKVLFPSALTAGKQYLFSATKDVKTYKLTVVRKNNTTIDFKFELTQNGIVKYRNSGLADLSSQFFLGAEGDDDDSGDGYGAYEYHLKNGECYFSIRVSIQKDQLERLRAKIIYGCWNSSVDRLELDDCPTLRTEKLVGK